MPSLRRRMGGSNRSGNATTSRSTLSPEKWPMFPPKPSMIGRSEFHRSSMATPLKTSTTATRRGCSIGPCLTGHCRSKDNNVKAVNDQRNA